MESLIGKKFVAKIGKRTTIVEFKEVVQQKEQEPKSVEQQAKVAYDDSYKKLNFDVIARLIKQNFKNADDIRIKMLTAEICEMIQNEYKVGFHNGWNAAHGEIRKNDTVVDMIPGIQAIRKKFGCSLMEAKQMMDFLTKKSETY